MFSRKDKEKVKRSIITSIDEESQGIIDFGLEENETAANLRKQS